MAEGGLIPINSQQQENISDESKTRENAPKEKYNSSSVVARKGVKEKTVKARKGVDQSSLDPEQATESISQIILEDTKSIVENTATKAFVSTNEQLGTSNVDTPKLNTNSSRPNDILDHHSANSSSILISEDTTVSHTVTTNVTTMQKSSSPTQKKHIPKPKPTVTTVGKSEINESRLPLRNKSSPLGAQGKIDYIVPVIITIIALPLLGTAIFVLYRRGRDCWDKRHYRRMDFLIDGMYNDWENRERAGDDLLREIVRMCSYAWGNQSSIFYIFL